MADPRFFEVAGPFSLEQLAEISGSKIGGNNQKTSEFSDIQPLSVAGANDVSFIDNRRYVGEFSVSKAGAILVAPELLDQAPSQAALLISDNPYTGYAKLTQAFYPMELPSEGRIDEAARIDPSAKIGKNVKIEFGAVIGKNAIIGDNSFIGANSYIGDAVEIGRDCEIGPNVTLTHCLIGNDNIIHPGVRVGQDGFGFSPGIPRHTKVVQLGRVLIGNEIEIGANSAIDRGAGPDTIIGDGTKIDNLVHIAHNVQIGQGCFITGQNGIAGSATIGNFVAFGGQVGVSGHVTIGDGVQVAAQSGVSSNIAAGETVAGTPAQNAREHWKGLAMLRKLVKEKRGK
ncbi:MAG: UDP-3-O-(3-hydroxymyristoyl)glucosamine N-acyltransferase [Rhodospirillaceae bacterium]|jgi:UDP-3-O-[3-hydroxymyristoyl] glucosamine N-acyltransferase|nr:UDP-3-O-(3-hydroxymyristoyl)glucosamine N-acyltransferase [Rhodospirillaceae bacterium]MBT4589274.1 UDP-3-O-(3-hydroxymyristoyl)glucosamine N-acyltransferase [Rhodospirillaceae bacterium]MBT5941105.1 UDP-3-O-(3-hydroxymyristoyl)glucosamine N-acyltransferase [Rhodospirillaceae bacterium]